MQLTKHCRVDLGTAVETGTLVGQLSWIGFNVHNMVVIDSL